MYCRKFFIFLSNFRQKVVRPERPLLLGCALFHQGITCQVVTNLAISTSFRPVLLFWMVFLSKTKIQLSFQDWRIYCILSARASGKNAFTRSFISFGNCWKTRDTITDKKCCKTRVIQMYFASFQCICKFDWFFNDQILVPFPIFNGLCNNVFLEYSRGYVSCIWSCLNF